MATHARRESLHDIKRGTGKLGERNEIQRIGEDRKIAHGTQVKGETSGNAKLSIQAVQDIRDLAETGHSLRTLAQRFGVHHATIWQVVKRQAWVHVTQEPKAC